jgi:hypothetical protein
LIHAALGIECSLASWWFGISAVVVWTFLVVVSGFTYTMGMTADLCNKAPLSTNIHRSNNQATQINFEIS